MHWKKLQARRDDRKEEVNNFIGIRMDRWGIQTKFFEKINVLMIEHLPTSPLTLSILLSALE